MTYKKAVALGLVSLSLVLGACTKVIEKGGYGPFSIGESSKSAYEKIIDLGAYPTPQVEDKVYIKIPTPENVSSLDKYDGILVWFNQAPFPIRIELRKDVVVKTWGYTEKCIATQHSLQIACLENNKIKPKLTNGITRQKLYEILLSHKSNMTMQMGNYVVGLQKFRVGESKLASAEYKTLLLKSNVWTFHGLKDLLWLDHFYSRVTLYFENSILVRIEHWRYLVELP